VNLFHDPSPFFTEIHSRAEPNRIITSSSSVVVLFDTKARTTISTVSTSGAPVSGTVVEVFLSDWR
jgi:hypothetical protein